MRIKLKLYVTRTKIRQMMRNTGKYTESELCTDRVIKSYTRKHFDIEDSHRLKSGDKVWTFNGEFCQTIDHERYFDTGVSKVVEVENA